jgi:putative membrane protein
MAPDNNSKSETQAQRLVYFAAERTLMSWIRTALSLMALGFVIDRFGLVLEQLSPETSAHAYPQAFSFWAGTTMVGTGVIMAIVAALRYLRFSFNFHRLRDTQPHQGILLGVIFAVIVALFGIAVVVFLTRVAG